VAWFGTRKTHILIFFGLAAVAALTASLWLGALGGYLVHAEPPVRADYAVVLAGDFKGHRVIEGAELARQGFVRKVLVSGPCCCYGVPESDMAVSYAVSKGYPEDLFIKLPHSGTSTWQEAQILIPELHRLGARSFLLVTSDYHTRRAGRYFSKLADGLAMRVIAAPDENFRRNAWWRNRESLKIFYTEWSKTIASFVGM
jgi:uncharacterized SAM-binding protein YcdF (DUF218 family)